MDMICHQTICVYLHFINGFKLTEGTQIVLEFLTFGEDYLPVVSALDDMVRMVG